MVQQDSPKPYGISVVLIKTEDLDRTADAVVGGRHQIFFRLFVGQAPPEGTIATHSDPGLSHRLEKYFAARKQTWQWFGNIDFNIQKSDKTLWIDWYPLAEAPKELQNALMHRGIFSCLELICLEHVQKLFGLPDETRFVHMLGDGNEHRKKQLEDRLQRIVPWKEKFYVDLREEKAGILRQIGEWKQAFEHTPTNSSKP